MAINETLKERVLSKASPEPNTSCWLWLVTYMPNGYGQLRFKQKSYLAHRASYMTFVGAIPDGKLICHHCDNRACVNPNHLFIGSYQDNHDDMTRKGRRVVHNKDIPFCKRGHPLSGDNIRTYGTKRHCRACQRLHARSYWRRKNPQHSVRV